MYDDDTRAEWLDDLLATWPAFPEFEHLEAIRRAIYVLKVWDK